MTNKKKSSTTHQLDPDASTITVEPGTSLLSDSDEAPDGNSSSVDISALPEGKKIADWPNSLFVYCGRGKTLKTSTALYHSERLLHKKRSFKILDFEPINKGLSSHFEEEVTSTPAYTVENGSDFAHEFFEFASMCSKGKHIGIVDTPGNDRLLVECAAITDLVDGVHAYNMKLIVVLCCGAEDNDAALFDKLAEVMMQPPDALVLCVNKHNLPSHLKSEAALRNYYITQKSIQYLMQGISGVVFTPPCRIMTKTDRLSVSLHRAAGTPPVTGLEVHEAGQLSTHLRALANIYKDFMP